MDFRPLERYAKRKRLEAYLVATACATAGTYVLFLAYRSEDDQGYMLLYLLTALVMFGAAIVIATMSHSRRRIRKEILSVKSGNLKGARLGFSWILDLGTVKRVSVCRKRGQIAKITLNSNSAVFEFEGYENMNDLWAEISASLGPHYFREGESGAWRLTGAEGDNAP